MGSGIFSSDSSSTNTSNQQSSQSSETNVDTTNTTINTNVTDNSMKMSSNVQSNTQVDSSQQISTTSTTDNSSIQNIQSSTDTYNVDNSQKINETIQNTTSKLIQSCGMTLEKANTVVNYVKNQSVNTNNTTIKSDLLESVVDFEGGDVDRSCVLDAANGLLTDLLDMNGNSKSMAGGEGGDVGAEAPVKTMQQDEYNPVIQSSTISCPVCAENIPSSSAVCPICAETLAIAQPSPPAKTSPSGHNKAPDNSIASTRENTMEEVLEELEKVNKNLSLIAKHLLFD